MHIFDVWVFRLTLWSRRMEHSEEDREFHVAWMLVGHATGVVLFWALLFLGLNLQIEEEDCSTHTSANLQPLEALAVLGYTFGCYYMARWAIKARGGLDRIESRLVQSGFEYGAGTNRSTMLIMFSPVVACFIVGYLFVRAYC